MNIITDDLAVALPPLYSQDGLGLEAIAQVKFFNPCGSQTWWLTEYDPTTKMAFGLCDLGDPELGYVSLEELQSLRVGPGGCLTIERDLYWKPKTLQVIMDGLKRGQRA